MSEQWEMTQLLDDIWNELKPPDYETEIGFPWFHKKRQKIFKAIRVLISHPPTPTVTREQVDAAVGKYQATNNDVYGECDGQFYRTSFISVSNIPALLADLGIGVEEKKS